MSAQRFMRDNRHYQAAKIDGFWDFVVRDPGDYEGRHRLLEGREAEHQFYPGGCPSCLYRVTS